MALAALVTAGVLVGFAFAGSPTRLPEGVRIAGIDVGGLTAGEARQTLARRTRSLEDVPVTFTVGRRRFPLRPRMLSVEVDWAGAVEAARQEGEGFGPVRGFRRLGVRFFGAEFAPSIRIYEEALRYKLGQVAHSVDRRPRSASLRLRGLRPEIVRGRDGRRLLRPLAAALVTDALAGFARAPVALPVRALPQAVTARRLKPAAASVRAALRAPVRLRHGTTVWRVPRWRLARLLELPQDGSRARIGGPEAERWLDRLARLVERPAKDAAFSISSAGASVVPGETGLAIDRRATVAGLLEAALTRSRRTARLAVATSVPGRTTAEANAMGISGLVGSYETEYGGEPNRIHNVQLVARLIDGRLIAPGATFSFNRTTGERTAEKGFLEAPVIINGELQTGLGGGVCQVSTTVFNAAYEAGLPIRTRTNHALYISHYPLGRDATVNYPDLDLRFANDTGRWLLLRTFVGPSSLVVNLYGTPTGRRVESEAAALQAVGAAPLVRVADPALAAGRTVLVDAGEPPRATSVRRKVYDARGKLLLDTTWYSSYRGETGTIRVGTKPKPKPEPKPVERPAPPSPAGRKGAPGSKGDRLPAQDETTAEKPPAPPAAVTPATPPL